MANALLSIFCTITLLAVSNGKQQSIGPQKFDQSSSSSMPRELNKEYGYDTQMITLYLTPSEMEALFDFKGPVNSQFQMEAEEEQNQPDIQNFNEKQQLNVNTQYKKNSSPNVEPKAELRGLLSHDSFYPKDKNRNFENQRWNYDFSKFDSEQKPKEEEKQSNYSDLQKNETQYFLRDENQRKLQQESALEKQSEWKPFNPESAIKEKLLKYEQLKQQWNTIFDQSRSRSKALSNQNQDTKEINIGDNDGKIIEQNSKNEEKSEVEKQIESILKQQQAFEDERQRALAQAEDNKKLPILIHKEISITRHHAVPVLKKVKVPTPVLVPIPEPYEVKIPHPYPVPYKIIKHIPVPVVKNY
ncbi:unnamed protein product [Euphydryas editha]|uniref:Uncharacterized protein n=1 Tax=Euphydryas editha TaxID=104508 RepID=A0AAU9TTS5_EUPED|nr:unnamed protein product [Euphydryas editha]